MTRRTRQRLACDWAGWSRDVYRFVQAHEPVTECPMPSGEHETLTHAAAGLPAAPDARQGPNGDPYPPRQGSSQTSAVRIGGPRGPASLT